MRGVASKEIEMNSEPYLDVNGISFSETLLKLAEGVRGVSIEDVEMADTVFAEEGPCHGSVESKGRKSGAHFKEISSR